MTQTREVCLQRDFSQGPITALSFFREGAYLLAGEDTDLAIYDLRSAGSVTRVPIFKTQPIHGIRALNGRVLVWGASKLAVLSEEALEGVAHGRDVDSVVAKSLTAPDWIYDAALSPFDSQTAVLVTAHNEVITVKFDATTDAPLLGVVISPSRPILYAANVKWTAPDSVLVAGGTIFGEILVWKYYLKTEKPELLSVLAGHEGSIFGVQISEELPCADGSKARLLVSCSDDRTIRIWDITERRGEMKKKHELSAPRETGFGSTIGHEELTSSKDAEPDGPIAVAMGHASRIWGAKIEDTISEEVLPDHALTIYSFGEDSTTQRWRLDLQVAGLGNALDSTKRLSGVLKHQETYALHDGKHLWSHAITTVGQQTLIATGGADSQISLITRPISSASTPDQHPVHDISTLDIPTVLSSIPNPRSLGPGREIVGRYDCISQTQILATSSLGRLMLGTFNADLQWREVDVDDSVRPDVKACYTMRAIGDGVALLGSTTGRLYHYSETQGMLLVGTMPGKIVNILLLTDLGDCHNESVEVLVHMHGVSDAQHYTLDWRTGAVLATTDVRGMDPRFVALSAARINGDLIAIGSRHGWLSILKQGEGVFRPVFDLASRSRDGITALVPLASKDSSQSWSSYFLATSRDGRYRIYQVEDGDQGVRLHLQNETSPPFGPFVEGGWFTQDSPPELILYGFRSHKMIVWNETSRQELAAIECGGSHRTFTFTHHPMDPHTFRFGFTRTSQLFIYSQQGPSHRSLKEGTHGREIRAVSYNGRYIATCAEDTTIRIWEYEKFQHRQKCGSKLRCLALLKLHISGIQQLQWLGDDCLLSSAGMEEFFVWRVQRLDDTNYGGLGVVCEAVFGDKSQDRDLRIMSFDAHRVGSDGTIIITMALSNSVIKTYQYTTEGSFRLLAQVSYTGACLTQIRHLGVDENGLSALTGSTDGHLATWEAKFDKDKPVSHVLVHIAPVHQNCVKSLDLRATPEGFQVLTGGDDNGLGISSLTPLQNETEGRQYAISSRGIVRKAHAAAINGVTLTQRGTETLGVSVSNDQRLKIWRIGPEKMELVADAYSGIADPGDVEVMRNDAKIEKSDDLRLVVGGVGIEIWNV